MMRSIGNIPFIRMAIWDAQRLPRLQEAIGQHVNLSDGQHDQLKTWPPQVRALSPAIRRRLKKLGLHRIESQLAMLTCLSRDGDAVDERRLRERVVQGYEMAIWRDADRRMLQVAHIYRAKRSRSLLDPAPAQLGPICVGLGLSMDSTLTDHDLVAQTQIASHAIYHCFVTAAVAGWVALASRCSVESKPFATALAALPQSTVIPDELIQRLLAGKHQQDVAVEVEACILLEWVKALLDDGQAEPANRSPHLNVSNRHLEQLDLIKWLFSAQAQKAHSAAVSSDALIAYDRLVLYVNSSRSCGPAPESDDMFLEREQELTQQEHNYQEVLGAERRSRRTEGESG